MNISLVMSLTELATLMGGATQDEAEQMRHMLCRSAYHGLTTADVLDSDWLHMLDKAVEQAAQKDVD